MFSKIPILSKYIEKKAEKFINQKVENILKIAFEIFFKSLKVKIVTYFLLSIINVFFLISLSFITNKMYLIFGFIGFSCVFLFFIFDSVQIFLKMMSGLKNIKSSTIKKIKTQERVLLTLTKYQTDEEILKFISYTFLYEELPKWIKNQEKILYIHMMLYLISVSIFSFSFRELILKMLI